jgi:hypothetical protein
MERVKQGPLAAATALFVCKAHNMFDTTHLPHAHPLLKCETLIYFSLTAEACRC